jgi:hypothetical protein
MGEKEKERKKVKVKKGENGGERDDYKRENSAYKIYNDNL